MFNNSTTQVQAQIASCFTWSVLAISTFFFIITIRCWRISYKPALLTLYFLLGKGLSFSTIPLSFIPKFTFSLVPSAQIRQGIKILRMEMGNERRHHEGTFCTWNQIIFSSLLLDAAYILIEKCTYWAF